jgi:NAD(P)-dependent dehydrogenase (short-subunit alcohol dehydrogenase family)
MTALKESVIVITGASSGIGRATALSFARRGATLVLGARRDQVLQEVAEECRQAGAEALVVPTDVTDYEAVQQLARQAVLHYGHLDVWVNNAGVLAFGEFDRIPLDVFRRVLETDLFGYIYGARAALGYFRKQRRGVLINHSSNVARISEPYVSPYVIAQHGIRAMGMSLRQELLLEGLTDVHVCTVMPASIDTPFFHHAANYTGRAPEAMPPVYKAKQVAEAIVRTAVSPRPELFVGASGRWIHVQSLLAPRLTERRVARMFDQQHLSRDKRVSDSEGNVFEPQLELTGVSGQWTRERSRPLKASAAVAALAVLPLLVAWRLSAQSHS